MLSPGQRIHDFTGEALYPSGEIGPIALAEYTGNWLVLFFWPLDFTHVCPTEIRGFNKLYPEFEALNCTVLGVSIDSAHAHRAWTSNGLGRVEFPLIGDVKRELAESLDILHSDGVALRATFIIDPEGVIQSASANALPVGRSPRETIRLVQAFQSGQLTGCEWQPGEDYVVAA
jgi:alkyl hydroperoxide reductase subunit AhpC